MSEIVEKWRSLQKGPRVPKSVAPRVPSQPRYDVKGIQSINPSRQEIARQYDSNRKKRIASQYVPATGSTMARRELTAQEMAGVYPGLVAKRPELLNRLAKRGVTYYIDPLLGQKKGYGGVYSPAKKTVTVQAGKPVGVAAHEVVHAEMATSWVNPARFLVDKRYRSARMADLAIAGDKPIGKLLQLYFLATGGIREANFQSESFAMGAYGSEAYPGIPVDYTDANRLFGGSFEGR